ncbi:MAG TPA: AAA family ATPase [Actinomycetales bacterium]|nr:AAA family ATPase [Actinomycetales bacterium]
MTASAPIASVPSETELRDLAEKTHTLRTSISAVLSGKDEVIETTVAVLLARGHLLLEDVPGVGKTTLATALAQALSFSVSRIQFTPDMLPSDLTGVTIYRAEQREFDFRPGPLFAQVVVGDEVNRASPKTQSALLECMQEKQVTVDGKTYPLPEPFFVIATQNPVEMEGTYPLPEAQRDRFMARIAMGYPDPEAELAMLEMHDQAEAVATPTPALDTLDIKSMSDTAAAVFASPLLKQYVIDLVGATRDHPDLRLGASPRAAIQLVKMAKVRAAMAGRNHVLPQDVQELLIPVWGHRILPRTSISDQDAAQDILGHILESVPVRLHTIDESTP